MIESSALHAIPLDTDTPSSTRATVRSALRRYSAPLPRDPSIDIVPAQNLPTGSHFPSFMRFDVKSASTSAIVSTAPESRSRWANPFCTASMSPPSRHSATAPTICPTSNVRSLLSSGHVWCTRSRSISIHISVDESGSHTGPSPSTACASTTSSGENVDSPVTRSPRLRRPTRFHASLPPRLEEPDRGVRGRVLAAGIVVEFHPEPRPLRHPETAVDRPHDRRVVHQVRNPGVGEVVEVLEHFVIGRGDREVDVGHRSHGSAHVVGGHLQVVDVGPPSEALHRQEATEVRDVRLDDVDQTLLYQLPEVAEDVTSLARGDRQRRSLPDAPQCRGVFRPHRLFYPADI